MNSQSKRKAFKRAIPVGQWEQHGPGKHAKSSREMWLYSTGCKF